MRMHNENFEFEVQVCDAWPRVGLPNHVTKGRPDWTFPLSRSSCSGGRALGSGVEDIGARVLRRNERAWLSKCINV